MVRKFVGDVSPNVQLEKPKWSPFADDLAQVRLLARTYRGDTTQKRRSQKIQAGRTT